LRNPVEVGYERHGTYHHIEYQLVEREQTHCIVYVELKTHGFHDQPSRWLPLGKTLTVDDFSVYYWGKVKEGLNFRENHLWTYGRQNEKTITREIFEYRKFKPAELPFGTPQPEPAGGYWPEHGFEDVGMMHWLVPDFRKVLGLREGWPFVYWYEFYGWEWEETRPETSSEWWTSFVASCADLHVYDNEGRHVGMNYQTGKIEEQIPGSCFWIADNYQSVRIYYPMGSYTILIIGRGKASIPSIKLSGRMEHQRSTTLWKMCQ
jgi:hypothetical protein